MKNNFYQAGIIKTGKAFQFLISVFLLSSPYLFSLLFRENSRIGVFVGVSISFGLLTLAMCLPAIILKRSLAYFYKFDPLTNDFLNVIKLILKSKNHSYFIKILFCSAYFFEVMMFASVLVTFGSLIMFLIYKRII